MSKATEKEANKTIVLGEEISSLGALKRALSNCGDDAKIEIKLCVNEKREVDHNLEHLKDLCRRLYLCLSDSRICVEKLAEEEKKRDTNLIYYDKFRGFNGGARDLLMVTDNLLDSYSKEMVQIDLER